MYSTALATPHKASRFPLALVLCAIISLSDRAIAEQKPDAYLFSLGINLNNYADQVECTLNRYRKNGKYGRKVTLIDLLGIYWNQEAKGLLLGGSFAADLARFRLLFLNKGAWNDQQIISSDWISEFTTAYSEVNMQVDPTSPYGYM